jgi:hypothetical protein
MHGLDNAGQDEVFEVHKASDWKEGINRCRPLDKGVARRYEVLNELEKTVADEEGDGKKGQLDRVTEEADVFSFTLHGDILPEVKHSRYDVHHRQFDGGLLF